MERPSHNRKQSRRMQMNRAGLSRAQRWAKLGESGLSNTSPAHQDGRRGWGGRQVSASPYLN